MNRLPASAFFVHCGVVWGFGLLSGHSGLSVMAELLWHAAALKVIQTPQSDISAHSNRIIIIILSQYSAYLNTKCSKERAAD